ncbi:MAG: hypothetical protein U9R17_13965 [Thermodesulfobacteriota bacterium]|nr:hypothetical protein [Thermodesulfobacteriota bacterium]
MGKVIEKDQWVWVIVQDPGSSEHFLGQIDKQEDVSFILTFLKKDDALDCLNILTLERGRKYEVQGIIYEDLASEAVSNDFKVYILNASGEILERINP